MKNTIKWCAPRFNTNRMVAEYTRKFYKPAAARWRSLTDCAMEKVKALSVWKSNIKQAWPDIAIEDVDVRVENGADGSTLNVKEPPLAVG